ncbi:hypothetical protein M2137_002333 [Parabacteroides sp. PFB2-10]|nr:hypothetical protein [Parabacteroides sp. PFB2-10]
MKEAQRMIFSVPLFAQKHHLTHTYVNDSLKNQSSVFGQKIE